MRHLRHIVLAALVVALWAAPVGGAHDLRQGRGTAAVTYSRGYFSDQGGAMMDAARRGPTAEQLQRGFNRRYTTCRHSSTASSALSLMSFVSRYAKRVMKVKGTSGKVRKCAKFELRFDSHVTHYQPQITTDSTVHAEVPLRWSGISSTKFYFQGSGTLEYTQYDYKFRTGDPSCMGDDTAKKDGIFEVSPGAASSTSRHSLSQIYTGPDGDALGDVTQLIYDPGTPVLYYTVTCDGQTINDSETVWRTIWADGHQDELFNASSQIDGPWVLRKEHDPQHPPPERLVSHEWVNTVNQPDQGSDEHTTLSIVRVK
jgi:hypothetical protein